MLHAGTRCERDNQRQTCAEADQTEPAGTGCRRGRATTCQPCSRPRAAALLACRRVSATTTPIARSAPVIRTASEIKAASVASRNADAGRVENDAATPAVTKPRSQNAHQTRIRIGERSCRRLSGVESATCGSDARHASSTTCSGRPRLAMGTNHQPIAQPGVKRRRFARSAKLFETTRRSQIRKAMTAATYTTRWARFAPPTKASLGSSPLEWCEFGGVLTTSLS